MKPRRNEAKLISPTTSELIRKISVSVTPFKSAVRDTLDLILEERTELYAMSEY